MAIRITCPGCKTSLSLDDKLRGKKVRCRECEKVLSIPAAATNGKPKKNGDDEGAVQEGRKMKAKASAVAEAEPDEDEDQPAKKKKKKKKAGPGLMMGLLIGGAALIVLLMAGVGVWAYKLSQKERDPAPPPNIELVGGKKSEEKPDTRSGMRIIVPTREEGNPANTKKGGKGVISNVRGSAFRIERKAELKSIQLSYIQFCDDYKGAERNMKNFMEFIRQSPSTIKDPIKEGYYVMNFKADPRSGESIIAFERDLDNQGHLCCKANGDIDYVPQEELKRAVGIP